MDYLQYKIHSFGEHLVIFEVLNLVINGLPSILINMMKRSQGGVIKF